MKSSKTIIALSLVLSLSACGGGGSDPEPVNNDQVDGISDNGNEVIVDAVDGELKTNVGLNAYAKVNPNNGLHETLGENSLSCSSNDAFLFETEHFQVFSETEYDINDYKLVAGVLDETVFGIFSETEEIGSLTGLSIGEYMQKRRSIAKCALDTLIKNYFELDSVRNSLPESSADWSEDEKIDYAWDKYIEASKDEQIALAIEAGGVDGYSWSEDDISHGNFIKVCMHSNTSSYVEETYTGINIVAPSVSLPDDYRGAVRNAMIQMYQVGVSNSVHGNLLPKWFANGQANYFTGIPADRNDHGLYDTTFVVSEEDLENLNDDPSLQSHFALAYQYLSNANVPGQSLFDIPLEMASDSDVYKLSDLESDYPYEKPTSGSLESAAFIKAFDSVALVDETGEPLSYQRYKYEYHSLMAN